MEATNDGGGSPESDPRCTDPSERRFGEMGTAGGNGGGGCRRILSTCCTAPCSWVSAFCCDWDDNFRVYISLSIRTVRVNTSRTSCCDSIDIAESGGGMNWLRNGGSKINDNNACQLHPLSCKHCAKIWIMIHAVEGKKGRTLAEE